MAIESAFIVPHPPLIFPEVGRGDEKKIQATIESYREVARRIAELQPETIVVTSPHSVMYADYFHISPGHQAMGNFAQFHAPDVTVKANYDEEFVQALSRAAKEGKIMAGTLGERQPQLDHGTMIPLRFVNEEYQNYRLVRIGLSGLPLMEHYRMGICIAKAAIMLDRKTVFIASGDLSHKLKEDGPYGFAKEGPEYDRRITEVMKTGDFYDLFQFEDSFLRNAAECGHRSFVLMAGALDGKRITPELLSYEGPYGVGYAVASFLVKGIDDHRRFGLRFFDEQIKALKERKEKEDPYVKLARQSLETYIKEGNKTSMPQDLPNDLLESQAGAFVSIKKHGQLRGCIGTIQGVYRNLAEEIMENAVSAGVRDPRFPPVTPEELEELTYSVDVLLEPEPIRSKEQLDVKKYGVIVSAGSRHGLLLPNLEEVHSVDQQIRIALQKAGIDETEDYQMERFEVERHH